MPDKEKPVDKKTAASKEIKKATLPKTTAAPVRKKEAGTPAVNAQVPPASEAQDKKSEAIKKFKQLKESIEGDSNEKAFVVQTDSKPKQDQEDKAYEEVSSLIDGIILDGEDDEALLEPKDELKEAVPEVEDISRKPEAETESDETIRVSLDTGKTKYKAKKTAEVKGELLETAPVAKHRKTSQHPADAAKRIDETKKPDRAESKSVDIKPAGKSKETKASPADAQKIRLKKDKIDTPKVEVSEIESGIEEMFSQFEDELKPEKKDRPLLDIVEITDKAKDALVEMEPIIEDALRKSDDKIKIAKKPQKAITPPLDTEKPKAEIKTIVTPDHIPEKKKRPVARDAEKIEKDKTKPEAKVLHAKSDIGQIRTKIIKRKPSRTIHVFGLFLLFICSAIAFTFFGPADKFNIYKTLKSFIAHKTGRTPEKPQAQKIIRPKERAVALEREFVAPIGSTPSKEMPREKEIIPERKAKEPPGVELEAPSDIEAEVIPEIEKQMIIADEIKKFLIGWKTAWENTAGAQGDIETYMSFYSDRFISDGIDKNGWKRDKALKNRRKEWIQIELEEIHIPETTTGDRIGVSFIQVYKSSNFSDESAKTLVLEKEETGWKIINIKAGRDSSQQTAFTEIKPQKDAAASGQKIYPYTIHVASYQDEKIAGNFITELKTEGLTAFSSLVGIPGKGDWYRISVGLYETLEGAQRVAAKLIMQKSLDAIVAEKPYAIQVGVFDMDQSLTTMESDLRLKGYTPYQLPGDPGNGKTRLLIGAFGSEKEAAVQLRKLEDDFFSPKVVKR